MDTIKAILVDDEPKLQRVLEVKLNRYCPNVEVVATAGDVSEAMVVIEEHQPDLVFLDIAMPGGSGFDLLRRLPRITFEVIAVCPASTV